MWSAECKVRSVEWRLGYGYAKVGGGDEGGAGGNREVDHVFDCEADI